MKTNKCLICKRKFIKNGKNHIYCSNLCLLKSRQNREHTLCECGKIKRKESISCRNCYLKKIYNKVQRKCVVCSKKFIVRKSTTIYDKAIFCSQDCYHKYRQGQKRPKHSEYLKKWWQEHPEEREKARQRGRENAEKLDWIKKVSSFGEKNPMWQGGIANSKYKGFYQKLKDKIRKRDNFICQLCNRPERELGYNLSVNHINFDKTNNREENLNALCKRCNSLINFKREGWTKYFQEKIAHICRNG